MNKKNIQVYTKKNEDSKHKSFKSTGQVDTSLDTIVHLMRDIENMPKWLHTSYDIEVIQDIDPATRLIHMKNKTPPVVKDRDLVLVQRMIKVSDEMVFVELVSKPDSLPNVEGYVRVPFFQGGWVLTKISDNKTKVEYLGQGDPGGFIPAWLSNAMLAEAPYQCVKKLQKQNYGKYEGNLDFLVTLDQAELASTKELVNEKLQNARN